MALVPTNPPVQAPAPYSIDTYAGSGINASADSTNSALAEFASPTWVATDAKGNVYVADESWGIISKVSPNGVVKRIARTNGEFMTLIGIAVDGMGEVFVSDYKTHLVRKISPGGVLKTLAGNGSGYVDAKGTNAKFGTLERIAADVSRSVFIDKHSQTISVGNFTNTISQTLTVFLSSTSMVPPTASSSSTKVELSPVSPNGGNMSITGKALGNAIITITAPATADFKKATKALPVKVIQVMPANG